MEKNSAKGRENVNETSVNNTGWSKKTKAVEWKFPFNCFCFFGPPSIQFKRVIIAASFIWVTSFGFSVVKNETISLNGCAHNCLSFNCFQHDVVTLRTGHLDINRM